MGKWISVTEDMPTGNGEIYEGCLEESTLVLVYGRDPQGTESYGMGRYIVDHYDPRQSGWNGYMDSDWELDHCNVTHWMPLPESQKEDAPHEDNQTVF